MVTTYLKETRGTAMVLNLPKDMEATWNKSGRRVDFLDKREDWYGHVAELPFKDGKTVKVRVRSEVDPLVAVGRVETTWGPVAAHRFKNPNTGRDAYVAMVRDPKGHSAEVVVAPPGWKEDDMDDALFTLSDICSRVSFPDDSAATA